MIDLDPHEGDTTECDQCGKETDLFEAPAPLPDGALCRKCITELLDQQD